MNALKHGGRSAAAVEARKQFAALLRQVRGLCGSPGRLAGSVAGEGDESLERDLGYSFKPSTEDLVSRGNCEDREPSLQARRSRNSERTVPEHGV